MHCAGKRRFNIWRWQPQTPTIGPVHADACSHSFKLACRQPREQAGEGRSATPHGGQDPKKHHQRQGDQADDFVDPVEQVGRPQCPWAFNQPGGGKLPQG